MKRLLPLLAVPCLCAALAAGFVATMVLGVILVLKLPNNRRLGVACLVLGLLIPLTLVWMAAR